MYTLKELKTAPSTIVSSSALERSKTRSINCKLAPLWVKDQGRDDSLIDFQSQS